MSLFVDARAKCQCGKETEMRLAASVNAGRRPDLRQEILDGTFQAETCPACGVRLRLPVHLSYLDINRGQWILAEGIELLAQWRSVEEEAHAVFERTYGRRAPKPAQEVGAELRPRLVFGWPALRESLICDELGLEAVALELLKIAIFRTVPEPPLGDISELRLTGGDSANLHFAWVDAAVEQELASLTVARALYDDVAEDPAPWAALRGELEGRLFVDFKRLTFA
jgi:hypothetical protein